MCAHQKTTETYNFSCWKQRTTESIATSMAKMTPGNAMANANSSMYVRWGISYIDIESHSGCRSRSGLCSAWWVFFCCVLLKLFTIWNAHQSNLKPTFSKIVCTDVRLYVQVAILYRGFTSSCKSFRRCENAVCDDKWTIIPSVCCGWSGTRPPMFMADSMNEMCKSFLLSGHKSCRKIFFKFSTRPGSVKCTQFRLSIFIWTVFTAYVVFRTINKVHTTCLMR